MSDIILLSRPSSYVFIGMQNVSAEILPPQTWVIDYGTTHHVSHDGNIFYLFRHIFHEFSESFEWFCHQNKWCGVVQINEHLSLQHVFDIPEFKLNLPSISDLTYDIGFRVIFDPSSFLIQDNTKALTFGKGRRIGNLYMLATRSSQMSVNEVIDVGVWHKRLGHLSFTRLNSISESLGTTRYKNKGSYYCRICHLAKKK